MIYKGQKSGMFTIQRLQGQQHQQQQLYQQQEGQQQQKSERYYLQ